MLAGSNKRPRTDQELESNIYKAEHAVPPRRRVKTILSRDERARARILHKRGFPNAKISALLSRSEASVVRVITGVTAIAANDNEDSDYEHVDKAFIHKYPPPQPNNSCVGNNPLPRQEPNKPNTRPNLNRGERGMIRILRDRGLVNIDIARVVGCTPQTVNNVLVGLTSAAARDEPSQDYQFVTEIFKMAYPEPLHSRPENQKLNENGVVKNQVENVMNVTMPVSQRRVASSSSSTSSGSQHTSNRSSILTTPAMSKAETPHASPGPSRLCKSIVLERSPSLEIVEDLEKPVAEFLATLDFDISFLHQALKKEGLGTSDKLFAIAGWTEDQLLKMLKEAVPEMTTAHRFALVIGLKKYAAAR